ncbi:hypothetical protein FZI93_11680, partial [Mycobacterium sp. CBMA361]|nr:hypothetical protein [Mycolicibacterium sp. CBMA 361]
TTIGHVCRALSLQSPWCYTLPPGSAAAIAAVTDLSVDDIMSMILAAYDGRALALHSENGRLDVTFPFGPLPRSRYCPGCLAETQGRWQLSWRLGWSFACVKHKTILLDRCPQCDAEQRPPLRGMSVAPLGLCRCGYALAGANAYRLPADSSIIRAQQLITEVIAMDRASFGVYAGNAARAREALRDVADLANCCLTYASIHGIDAVKQADELQWPAANWTATYAMPSRVPLPAHRAPPSAAHTAVGVTAAMDILLAHNVVAASRRAHWLIDGIVADGAAALQLWKSMRGGLSSAVVIRASRAKTADALPAAVQLQYRVWSSNPRAPDLTLEQRRIVAAALPSELWRDWSVRLLGPTAGRRDAGCVRALLAEAVLLNGAVVADNWPATLLGHGAKRGDCDPRAWDRLCHSRYWHELCQAFERLACYLLDTSAPIDYRRRRDLRYVDLLDNATWTQMCRDAGYLPVDRFEIRAARGYLIELLTAASVGRVCGAGYVCGPRVEQEIDPFAEGIPQELRHSLWQEGRNFLGRHSARMEPLQWHPPLDLIDDLHLPGPTTPDAVLYTVE